MTITPSPENQVLEPPERIWLKLADFNGHQRWIESGDFDSGDIPYARVRAGREGDVWANDLYQIATRVLRWLYATMNPNLPIDKSLLKVTQFEIHKELECAILDAHAARIRSTVTTPPAATAGDASVHYLLFEPCAVEEHSDCIEYSNSLRRDAQLTRCSCACHPYNAPTPSSPARAAAEELIEHVARSGVEFDGQKDYIVVQIDRDVWQEIQKLANDDKGGR